MINYLGGKTRGALTAVVLGTALIASLPVAAAGLSGLLAQADQAATGQTDKGQDLEKHVQAEIKRLHQELHITAAQEQQWNAVADVMRANAAEMSSSGRRTPAR
jgi:LTXXQ motif family protein